MAWIPPRRRVWLFEFLGHRVLTLYTHRSEYNVKQTCNTYDTENVPETYFSSAPRCGVRRFKLSHEDCCKDNEADAYANDCAN